MTPILAHAVHAALEMALFAPAFIVVGVAIVRQTVNRRHERRAPKES